MQLFVNNDDVKKVKLPWKSFPYRHNNNDLYTVFIAPDDINIKDALTEIVGSKFKLVSFIGGYKTVFNKLRQSKQIVKKPSILSNNNIGDRIFSPEIEKIISNINFYDINKNKIDKLKNQILKYKESIKYLQDDIDYYNTHISKVQLEIDSCNSQNIDSANLSYNLKLEIEKTFENKNVVDIFNYKEWIIVSTSMINFAGSDKPAGRFAICVNFIKKDIRFFNLSFLVKGYYHPHVHADGNACLGNMTGSIIECIINYKLSALIGLCISFLSSYTQEDGYEPYVTIKTWNTKKYQVPIGEEHVKSMDYIYYRLDS